MRGEGEEELNDDSQVSDLGTADGKGDPEGGAELQGAGRTMRKGRFSFETLKVAVGGTKGHVQETDGYRC